MMRTLLPAAGIAAVLVTAILLVSIWILAPGLPTVVGSPAWASQLDIRLPAASALSIENRRGRFSISYEDRTDCRVQVNLHVYALSPGGKPEARKAGEALAEALSRRAGPGPARLSTCEWFETLDADVEAYADFTLVLPRGLPLTLDNGHGNIHVKGAHAGPISVRAANADVTVRGAPAPVDIEVITGHVRVYDAEAGARIASVNGNVALHLFGGKGMVSATNGTVVARLLSPEVRACSFESQNGGVSVSVPPDAPLEVDAASQFGRVRCDLPLALSEERRHRILGTLNGGGAPLRLRSKNGNVWIAPGEAL